ncbi:EF-P beta-lysylation protein EpmB [Halorhodospira halophila]|uniref:L-lysine 2,3-aminomutase n=1 Tax=Halorhodospira halophila (strain DSM 244 / SL1) TaxID=349124 RepID=A1WYI2_HALHL|nr:EF-P beta-lysylation protein EpmB [Halorhodospira halophila]ABM62744.1 L-lysine 2,3-aminomutase [Halorhodospira halophila SL1]MBK1728133.1 EF-P beta-lysylation protein EpmB [Halorhodospira halophila]
MLTDTARQPKPGRERRAAERWRQELIGAIRQPEELLRRLDLPESLLAPAEQAARTFPMRVPVPYLARIRPGDPNDPLLRQVLPIGAELETHPGYTADPLAEQGARTGSGVLQKYNGRSLLIATGGCAIHCRYCFRRCFPYNREAGWRTALDQLEQHGAPEEVILSGGDPLLLDDQALGACLERLGRIAAVRRVRIHTRLPVVIPSRVTAALARHLGQIRLQSVIVVHANHPREIDAEVSSALARLRNVCSTVLNQTVLLRGVNDDTATLASLSERLFAADVLPYYLHLLDPVAGAAHFDVDAKTGQRLWAELARSLPGYLVPRLAREEPGAAAKTVITPDAP